MPKTRRLKLVEEETPMSVVGTRRWKQNVPEHLRSPLAKALRYMDENNVSEALNWFGQTSDLCRDERELKPVLYFGSQVAAQRFFSIKGEDPNRADLAEFRLFAETIIRGAVELSPDDPVPMHNLGRFLQDAGDDATALKCYQRAAMLDPSQIETWGNAGTLLYQQGDVASAWKAWDKAISLDADKASARIAQSYIWLRKGMWKEGWQAFNDRWQDLSFLTSYGRKDLSGIHWLGGPLPKKHRLLLHGEQGLGDHVQFARFARLLAERDIRLAGIETRAVLKRWMQCAHPDIPVFARDVDPLPTFTHHCSTMDLPGILGITPETVPPPVEPECDPERVRSAFHENLLVGIAWEGSKGNTADSLRSIPREALRHLADIRGVTFVNLQFAEDAALAGRAWLGQSFVDGTQGCTDTIDTAAVIRGLDLVITVDTLTAHLAGTLGVPTWTLHRFCREWRWLDESVAGEKCPWYPNMRSLSQRAPGDWTELLLRVRSELEAKAK